MPTSLDGEVYAALATHLDDLSIGYDIAWMNVNYPKKSEVKGEYYLEVSLIQNGSLNYAVGEEPEMVQGILQVSVKTPLGIGLTPGQDIAGQIKTHFAKGLVLWGDGVRVEIDGAPNSTGPLIDADRAVFPVSINYQAEAL